MPTDSAKPIRRVFHLVYPCVKLLDLAGPTQVFREVSEVNDGAGYDQLHVSTTGGLVQTDTDLVARTRVFEPGLISLGDVVVVPGGDGVYAARGCSALVQSIRDAHGAGARIVSTCTGAFLLAHAGLLDDARATTHWSRCARLRREYPRIDVVDDALFIRDNGVWTSAGVTAGIDLSLSIVEDDFGRRVALDVARALVVYGKRPGGQSQFSAHLRDQFEDACGEFDELHAWVLQRIGRSLTIEDLARQQRMSLRSFHRRYRALTGVTPGQMLGKVRVDTARAMLESGDSLSTIATRCGFGTEETLRRSFQRELGISPTEYRTAWSNRDQ